jgi:hypothetical protein
MKTKNQPRIACRLFYGFAGLLNIFLHLFPALSGDFFCTYALLEITA